MVWGFTDMEMEERRELDVAIFGGRSGGDTTPPHMKP